MIKILCSFPLCKAFCSYIGYNYFSCRALEFMKQLDQLSQTQNLDLGDSVITATKTVNPYRLRAIIDSITEQLPSLLELGDVPENKMGGTDFDFAYHRPSIISIATTASALMPESIGFVLLQV